ncbi:lysozyme [Weissella coleopterorum]|uniref:Lysozyme n=1 Tax=Weissella coleopterorum TaxID=2714949 RepID=A0A6G8AXZ5_9LACO|nr:GH25 family lysozyme [Weissella coleopterorum]QIL49850.1 lysozyme [Weissella coleopterorum]
MSLNGIDISSYQSGINIANVPADFVIVKATQGVNYVSPDCDNQVQQVIKSNKLLGVYHFADGSGAEAEATYFLANIQGYLGKAVLFLDWEASVVNNGVAYAKTFMDYVYNQTGIRPIIYMSKSVTAQFDWSSVSKDYALWFAQYANNNETGYQSDPWTDSNGFGSWIQPAMQQYSSHGKLSGYDGNLDLDIFYGDSKAWANFAKSDNVIPTVKTPIVQYPDPDGNPSYALTHWNAVKGKPFTSKNELLLTSPNGTKFTLAVTDSGELKAVKT